VSGPRRIAVVAGAEAAGERLDRFLTTRAAIGTRSRVKQLVDAGCVRVDGAVRKAGFVLRAGMRVVVDVPAPPPSAIEPEALPLTVLYEDADLLAIDKPPGMVVHPAPGARRGTVVNALLHRTRAIAAVGEASRPGIVHRLDKDTSGVLLVARTPEALEGLARQFRARSIEKHYVALVHGAMRAEQGTIDRAIGRDPRDRKRMSVRSRRGRSALTRWTVRERLPGATLLDVLIETGRTHQIRVHLASAGHPLVGDGVYGGRRRAGVREASDVIAACPRQALHAARLACVHPRSGERLLLEAPLPPDLVAVVEGLRKVARSHGNRGRVP
jgi:23S rRNA pseudouridine1911/1915/1917 synthase